MNDARAVAVIDRVVLPAENATEWVDRMRAEYAPGAAERGMQLADSWWAYVGPDQIEVTLRWELPDSATFWAMRFAAARDESVAAWWADTDAMAVERHRVVGVAR